MRVIDPLSSPHALRCLCLVIRRMIERLYPSVSVRQILDGDDALLMRMLVSGDCQLIVLNHPISDKGLTCVPFMRESLTLAVPKGHILERFETLHFSDFNGYNIVLNPDIGFWMVVCRRHLPASHLLVQRTSDAFGVIAENSDIFLLQHIGSLVITPLRY